ncbi:sugar ABC transporter ATP-binding protein [Mangrovactinospora gilvigrisea]|uniref:Sugar ABC transporter ATP-binding protein n=1 Tax=Mangrovactinospora gilvigrisea TaxID=1428644 RepID=A0A1J7BCB8_9ACTN|nr:carbohydrate ABC transporter permease [Mangrovactinospora gilvigrisea]OIV36315.1 sugar ABC transporter ATP-binding protein [Mangrovactinospora gilvigrisea]
MRRPRSGARRFLLYAVLCVCAAATLLPFLWLVRSALMKDGQIFKSPPEWLPSPFAWHNFGGALTAQPFGRYFLNTLTLELAIVPGVLFVGSISAFAFARLRWRGRNTVFAVLLSALMLPYAVTLVPTFIGWQYAGLVGTYVPLSLPAWLGAGQIGSIFLLRQFFLSIPRELDDAAYVDGARPWTVYWRIVLPLSRPALLVVGIFTFIGVWNDFLNPLIYLADAKRYTLSLGLAMFQGSYSAQWGYLMAASTIVILPIIVLFFLAQRHILEGITLTGLKG